MIIASKNYNNGYSYAFPLVNLIEKTFPDVALHVFVWRDSGYEHLDDDDVLIKIENANHSDAISLNIRPYESSLEFGDVYDLLLDEYPFRVYTEDGIEPLIKIMRGIVNNEICSVGAFDKETGYAVSAMLFEREIIHNKSLDEIISLLPRDVPFGAIVDPWDGNYDGVRILFWENELNHIIMKSISE